MKLFSVDYDHDKPGCAYVAPGVWWNRVPRSGPVQDWKPVDFELRDGAICDYQSNDVGWRLCSPRLREMIDAAKDDSDPIQWLAVNVLADGVPRPSWVMHFPDYPDTLDMDRTVFAPNGSVIKPVYRASAIGRHRVFGEPGGKALATVVVDDVRETLVRSGLSGMNLTPLRVTS